MITTTNTWTDISSIFDTSSRVLDALSEPLEELGHAVITYHPQPPDAPTCSCVRCGDQWVLEIATGEDKTIQQAWVGPTRHCLGLLVHRSPQG